MKLQVNRFGSLEAVTPISKKIISGIDADDSMVKYLLSAKVPKAYQNDLCKEFRFTSLENSWK